MKKSDQQKISIIIPSKIFDHNLNQCVKKIRQFYKYIKIIIVLDKKNYFIKDKNIKTIISGPKPIGQKRNLGVKYAKTFFITFIDSDAYPDHQWLNSIIESFQKYKNKNVAVVGGPNLSPQTNNVERKLVSRVRKLFFTTYNAEVKQKSNNVHYVSSLSSVNFTVKRKVYIKIGGMDNNLNVGEDMAFMRTLRKYNYKILFNGKSYVYHIDRNIKHFFRQRFFYGTNSIILFLKYPDNKSFLFLLSIFPFLYVLFLIPIIFAKFIYLKIYLFFLSGIILFCIINALRINFSSNFIKSLYVVGISIFGPGIGFVASLFLSSKMMRKLYTQS